MIPGRTVFLRRCTAVHLAGHCWKPLVNPVLSELGGRILDSRLSALAVPVFIRHAGIDMRDYEKRKFRSYNDFFTRRIRECEAGQYGTGAFCKSV